MTKQKLELSFLGAAGTVTGSRYLLQGSNQNLLVDCGMFQGYKNLRQRNWQPFPVDPATIDTVVLSHAHLDHCGYLPVLVANGFKGNVYCTEATRALCEVILLDAAHLQEEEAIFRNRNKSSRHHPALPLFTTADAKQALSLIQTLPESKSKKIGEFSITLHHNGHILGSSYVDVEACGKHLLFSGDLGRYNDLIMKGPSPPCYCDYLIVESTYGDRNHRDGDLEAMVADLVNETVSKGGSVLIPAFAVGRAQAIIYLLYKLRKSGRIPYMPIYLDSPMAIKATEIMQRYHAIHRLSEQQCKEIAEKIKYTRTVEQSQGLASVTVPSIIVSASGMATGGRVLHHMRKMIGDSRNTILFAGYQAGGTRGAHLVGGATSIKIHGEYFSVKARIETIDYLSAHADSSQILDWLRKIPVAPKHCFVTHGEPEAADAQRINIQEQLGWSVSVPDYRDTLEL